MTSFISIEDLSLFYKVKTGFRQALFGISLNICENKVHSLIGPSGCGKSTLLRCINRMNDEIEGISISGKLKIGDQSIYSDQCNVLDLRRNVGMVFQRPTPFLKSIYENVAFGPRVHKTFKNKAELDEIVEKSLISAGLFYEVKDRLNENAYGLSGGQQQRLCIARTIAIRPRIILMDEPCSALDPIATEVVENLIYTLKKDYTIVLVTHSMQQAARISDFVSFFYQGRLIETGESGEFFTNPKDQRTQNYLTGRKIES